MNINDTCARARDSMNVVQTEAKLDDCSSSYCPKNDKFDHRDTALTATTSKSMHDLTGYLHGILIILLL